MVAYIVFTRERTRDQAELDTYSQEVSASLTGHPLQRAHTMDARKTRGFGRRGRGHTRVSHFRGGQGLV